MTEKNNPKKRMTHALSTGVCS